MLHISTTTFAGSIQHVRSMQHGVIPVECEEYYDMFSKMSQLLAHQCGGQDG